MMGSSCSSKILYACSSTFNLSASGNLLPPSMLNTLRCLKYWIKWSKTVSLSFSSSLRNRNATPSKPVSGFLSFEMTERASFVTSEEWFIFYNPILETSWSWTCSAILWLRVPARHSKLPECTFLPLMETSASKNSGSSSTSLKFGARYSSWLRAEPLDSSEKMSV